MDWKIRACYFLVEVKVVLRIRLWRQLTRKPLNTIRVGTSKLRICMSVPAKIENTVLNIVQEEYPGYHPVLALARLVHDKETTADEFGNETSKLVTSVGQQIDIHKTLLKYIEPELKSMEVKGNVHHDHGVLRVEMVPHDQEGQDEIIPVTYEGEFDEVDELLGLDQDVEENAGGVD